MLAVSYDPAAGLFKTDTLDPAGFQTLLEGQTYLSGTIKFAESFAVTFIDWNDIVLSEQIVALGADATAPADPSRPGYVFAGWDKGFSNVQGNLLVQATYTPVPAEGNGTPGDGDTAESGGTPVPVKPADDPRPVPSAGDLAPTGDSSTPFASFAAVLSLTAGIALAAAAGLARRRG